MLYDVTIAGVLNAVQTDTHYAVLSLLLLLANSPTNAAYRSPTASELPGVIV